LVAAYVVAICADVIEICLAPLFFEGFASPLDDFLDVLVCVILTRKLGWHFAFLPSFAFKLMPNVDIAPTWTIAVLIASRNIQTTPTNDVSSPPVINLKPEDVSVQAAEEKPPKATIK
jgi:hypothetical protein